MHEKSLFGYSSTPLSQANEGPVSSIRWRGRFVAWSCAKGVRVYDVVQKRIISIIKGEAKKDVPFRIAW